MIHRRAADAFLLGMAALACASGPRQLYDGPARPDGEVAAIAETPGTRARVYAIDEQRAPGESWTILPGPHVVWVDFEMVGHGGGTHTTWSYCRIDFVAAAGGVYRVESFAMPQSEPVARADAVGAAIVDAHGAVIGLAQTCSLERPRFR
jgi:hypothetical protein